MSLHAAVDLGASSGRVILGRVTPRSLQLEEVHRFPNAPLDLAGSLHWDITGLYREMLTGLERLPRDVATVGIDSWAIDYGLLDQHGALLGVPYSYRDGRTNAVLDKVHAVVSPDRLYQLHGLQHLPFTTLYQLAAQQLGDARTLLLIPDLLTYWLTGSIAAEITNASTTGLLDAGTREWSPELAGAAGVPMQLLPPLVRPGQDRGPLREAVRQQTRFQGRVVSVGSHDTASAIVAAPMVDETAAYICLGTWGLVGVETSSPVLTEASRAANFTNELGVDGRVRFLRNVTGLFLLTEVLHHWRFTSVDRDNLLRAAAELPPGPVFDVDDPRLASPGRMPAKICDVLQDSGWAPPRRKVALVRCVLDSLAAKLASTVHEAATLTGNDVRTLHLVGGGAQNALLCQLTADAAGLPVVAGPVEATAIGNLLVQARADGTLSGDLEELRALVRRTYRLTRYEPRSGS